MFNLTLAVRKISFDVVLLVIISRKMKYGKHLLQFPEL